MEQDMTRGNPLSVIFMFTLPLAVGNIFQQLYNMADTIIVGRFVGADALAALQPAFPFLRPSGLVREKRKG